jgi:hypothetical protein
MYIFLNYNFAHTLCFLDYIIFSYERPQYRRKKETKQIFLFLAYLMQLPAPGSRPYLMCCRHAARMRVVVACGWAPARVGGVGSGDREGGREVDREGQ